MRALNKMAMKVVKDGKDENGWRIEATASERRIEIELERLTRRATRMRVVVNQGTLFFKDAATGTEIIINTAEVLERRTAKRL